jgi:hypothetical protein
LKPAAFVSDGPSLAGQMSVLKALEAKVFATPKALPILEAEGIRAQPMGDPIGITRIFNFGHKTIHLFGFDLCSAVEEGTRICFDSRIFYTTPDQAMHAQMMIRAAMELRAKGASICVHGDGMLQSMASSVMRKSQERVLNAVYDMQVCPPTYEFFSFLSQAEKYRAENGFTSIDVLFFPGPMHGFRDDGLPPSAPERQSMLHRICVSGSRLLPTVRNVHVMQARSHVEGEVFPPDWSNDRPRYLYGPKYQKNGHRCLAATQAARDEINLRFTQPYATITLRQAEYWPNRNSDLKSWDRVARELRARGIAVVVVPDTHGKGLQGCEEFTPAAWDIDLRLALYESAVLNLGVANGPMALLHLAVEECPYIVFQQPAEDSATHQSFLDEQGIRNGDQWSENGWTVWEKDEPENVMRALAEWFKKEKAA